MYIVHLIRNETRFIPTKSYKEFTRDLKVIYSAINKEKAKENLKKVQNNWKEYLGAIRVFVDNFDHVLQLYNYGSDVRRIMYTTNPIEVINSSYRKVTKKGAFPNGKSLFKVLNLRIKELDEKWSKGYIRNWSVVLNHLMIDDKIAPRLEKYFEN